jgi:hypothetical protein
MEYPRGIDYLKSVFRKAGGYDPIEKRLVVPLRPAVLKHKPIRKPGQDIRQLPTYTIPEAAAYLAILQNIDRLLGDFPPLGVC